MYEVSRHGPVVRIRMARKFFGRPTLWVNAFWVDGLLIDTGCRHTVPDLLRAIEQEGLRVEQLVNTHTDEDHVAGNPAVCARFGVTARVHPLGLERLARPLTVREMPFYRRFFWGLPEGPSPGAPLDLDAVATDRYRFRLLHTPGHAPDHVALFEEQEGWLFSGDLMVSPRLSQVRSCEHSAQTVESMRLTTALPVRKLFCSHAFKVYDDISPMRAKLERWERIQQEARQLRQGGLSIDAIARRLLGPSSPVEWVSGGEFHRRHLINGLLEGGAHDIPA